MSWLSTLVGVLFVGHSLFGHTNPRMLEQVLQARAPEIRVDAQIINGAPLQYNWANSATAEGVDARAVLPEGRHGAVILTEAVPLANHIRWSETNAHALKFFDLATRSRAGARVFLQETWHSLDSGTGVDVPYDDNDQLPWRERLRQDLPQWQGIVAAVNAARPPDTVEMALIPAGQAMGRLQDAIDAGTMPGLSDIRDVFADDIHPNDIGFYYLTMVQYAALTGESPVGLPHLLKDHWGNPYHTPDAELAARLQALAWDSVRAYRGEQAFSDPALLAPPPATRATPAQATTPAPAPADRPRAAATPATDRAPMAIGLAEVTDWSVQQPFLDVMKTARPWIGHMPGQWGGTDHDDLAQAGFLDDHGWPLAIPAELGSIGTVILTDLPEQAQSLAGRYRLRFDGDGIVEVGGRARNVRYGKGEVEFDFEPGPGPVDIRIQRTNRAGTGLHLRNISVVKLDHAAAYDAGARFNPDWLARLQRFDALRFMDWMRTNNSAQSQWQDRPQVDDYTYALSGVPVEFMVALVNELGVDGWFNMPHLADDDYLRQFATLVRDRLGPERRAYVEFSNEVWNWQFEQTRWADEQAQARWQARDSGLQYYGMRAAEAAQIWSDVFGAEADARLVNVISSQTGWLGLETLPLEAPLWVAETPDGKAPATFFDAYAVTGYFGGILGTEARAPMVRGWIADSRIAAEQQADAQGLSGASRDSHVAQHRYDVASALAGRELRDGSLSGDTTDTLAELLGKTLPYQAEVARAAGLDLIMYEGGSHVVGIGPMLDDAELTAFWTHLNYTQEMGALYAALIEGWRRLSDGLFTAYLDVQWPGKWGSWGTLRFLGDDNPRWDALVGIR